MSPIKLGVILVLLLTSTTNGQTLCGSKYICGRGAKCTHRHCECIGASETNPYRLYLEPVISEGRQIGYCREVCNQNSSTCPTYRSCQQVKGENYACLCAANIPQSSSGYCGDEAPTPDMSTTTKPTTPNTGVCDRTNCGANAVCQSNICRCIDPTFREVTDTNNRRFCLKRCSPTSTDCPDKTQCDVSSRLCQCLNMSSFTSLGDCEDRPPATIAVTTAAPTTRTTSTITTTTTATTASSTTSSKLTLDTRVTGTTRYTIDNNVTGTQDASEATDVTETTLTVDTSNVSTNIPDPGIAGFNVVDEDQLTYILAGIGGAFAILFLVLVVVCISWWTEKRGSETSKTKNGENENVARGTGNRPRFFDYSSPFPARQMQTSSDIANNLDGLGERSETDGLSAQVDIETLNPSLAASSKANTADSGHVTRGHTPEEDLTLMDSGTVLNPLYMKTINSLQGIRPIVPRGTRRDDKESLLQMIEQNNDMDNMSSASEDDIFPSKDLQTRL